MTSTSLAILGFDYGSFEPVIAAEAQALAVRIRAFGTRTMAETFAIGRDLIAMKKKIGHGSFGAWLSVEFPGAERTAQRWMAAAETCGDKSDILAELPATAVYALAAKSTPEPVRASIIERIERGEPMTPQGVVSLIHSGREEHRQKTNTRNARLRRQARNRPVDPKAEARQRRREEREEQEIRDLRARRTTAMAEAVAIIRERLTAAEIERLTDLLEIGDSYSSFTKWLKGERPDGWVDPDILDAVREAANELSAEEQEIAA